MNAESTVNPGNFQIDMLSFEGEGFPQIGHCINREPEIRCEALLGGHMTCDSISAGRSKASAGYPLEL